MTLQRTNLQKVKRFLGNNTVTILFLVICAFGIPLSGYSANYLVSEVVVRIARNSFLIVSLLIPILAGMGLNFGMTLGAMAGQIGLVFISDWGIVGIPGIVLAMIISTPISVALGIWCGKILNMAKGREMVTSYIIGFFMNGIYQLVVSLYKELLSLSVQTPLSFPEGMGYVHVNLIGIRKSLDNI